MIFRSAARPPRSGSFPLRRAPRPGDIPPQIEKPCARSRLHKILQPTPAKCQPLYSAPHAPPSRHDPPAPERVPSYALTRDLCPCALMFRDAPASCGLPVTAYALVFARLLGALACVPVHARATRAVPRVIKTNSQILRQNRSSRDGVRRPPGLPPPRGCSGRWGTSLIRDTGESGKKPRKLLSKIRIFIKPL